MAEVEDMDMKEYTRLLDARISLASSIMQDSGKVEDLDARVEQVVNALGLTPCGGLAVKVSMFDSPIPCLIVGLLSSNYMSHAFQRSDCQRLRCARLRRLSTRTCFSLYPLEIHFFEKQSLAHCPPMLALSSLSGHM